MYVYVYINCYIDILFNYFTRSLGYNFGYNVLQNESCSKTNYKNRCCLRKIIIRCFGSLYIIQVNQFLDTSHNKDEINCDNSRGSSTSYKMR